LVWASSSATRACSSRSRPSSACALSSAARSRATRMSLAGVSAFSCLRGFPSPSRFSSFASSRSRAAIASARSRSVCFSRSSSAPACACSACRCSASSRASRSSASRSGSTPASSGLVPPRRGVHESKPSSQRSMRAPLSARSWARRAGSRRRAALHPRTRGRRRAPARTSARSRGRAPCLR
jgi:hypothetical protein